MSQPITFLLCSTFHDPQFRLKSLVKSALPIIKKLFVKGIICLTSFTSNEVHSFLRKEGFITIIEPTNKHIDTYRTAVRTTLDNIDDTAFQRIFHIDFDRLIHWIHSYPDELINILRDHIDAEYLHIGRSFRSFDTHPTTQKMTETIINEIGSKILGFDDPIDIISICFILTKELGGKILTINNFTTTGFYGSWPIYLWNWARTKKYVSVEGLEWETPDRFKKEIMNIGYEEWIKQFQTSAEWKKRVKYMRECLLELSQLTDFKFREEKIF